MLPVVLELRNGLVNVSVVHDLPRLVRLGVHATHCLLVKCQLQPTVFFIPR